MPFRILPGSSARAPCIAARERTAIEADVAAIRISVRSCVMWSSMDARHSARAAEGCLDLNQAACGNAAPLRRRTARAFDFHAIHVWKQADHGIGLHCPEAELHTGKHDVGRAGRDQIDRLALILFCLDAA